MAILSFKKRFAPKIEKGTKRQTIRGPRKYPIVKGERLFLYTGLRTKYASKIGEAFCENSFPITINAHAIIIHKGTPDRKNPVLIEDLRSLNKFAKADGFESWADLQCFWSDEHGGSNCFPFHGTIIYWQKLLPESQWNKQIPSGFQSQNPVRGKRLKSSSSRNSKKLVNEAHQLPGNDEAAIDHINKSKC